MTNISKFEIGRTYSTRSACDHECIFEFTVTKRTAKTVTFKYLDGEITRRVTDRHTGDSEACLPLGNYSMAPFLTADDDD